MFQFDDQPRQLTK